MRGLRPLSKSGFVDGYRCPKLLWLKVHEPQAKELDVGPALQDRFDQGTEVGMVAARRFPGGEMVGGPHFPFEPRVRATEELLDQDRPAIFEASFLHDDVYCAVDVLQRLDHGFALVEVKSSTSLKDAHVVDAAIQTLTVRGSGLDVRRVEVMHLNPDHRHPDRGNLFVQEDVTTEVDALQSELPNQVKRLVTVLKGPEPDAEIGPHCFHDAPCPFMSRCWPTGPEAVVSLAGVGPAKALAFIGRGIHTIADIPETERLSELALRQLRAEETGEPYVGPGLANDLGRLKGTIGFLDFETVARALPRWPGTGPWQQIPVQFSYHESDENGKGPFTHKKECLAEGTEDPRETIAEALVTACEKADHILTYTTFEKRCIRTLREAVPRLSSELASIELRLFDLYPLVKTHVYHPDFHGSFSIKKVLPALVPGLSYDDLAISDGLIASARIARLMFDPDSFSAEGYQKERRHLLEYCKLDTHAMVMLLEALRVMAGIAPKSQGP